MDSRFWRSKHGPFVWRNLHRGRQLVGCRRFWHPPHQSRRQHMDCSNFWHQCHIALGRCFGHHPGWHHKLSICGGRCQRQYSFKSRCHHLDRTKCQHHSCIECHHICQSVLGGRCQRHHPDQHRWRHLDTSNQQLKQRSQNFVESRKSVPCSQYIRRNSLLQVN